MGEFGYTRRPKYEWIRTRLFSKIHMHTLFHPHLAVIHKLIYSQQRHYNSSSSNPAYAPTSSIITTGEIEKVCVCAPPVFYEINHLSFDACNEFKENRRYVILEIGVVEGLRGIDR